MHFETAYDIGDVLWHINRDRYGHFPPFSIEMVEINQLQVLVKKENVSFTEVHFEVKQHAILSDVSKLQDIKFVPVTGVYGHIINKEDFYRTQEEALGAVLMEWQAHKETYYKCRQPVLEDRIRDMKRQLKSLPDELIKTQKELKDLKTKLKAFEKEKRNEKRK